MSGTIILGWNSKTKEYTLGYDMNDQIFSLKGDYATNSQWDFFDYFITVTEHCPDVPVWVDQGFPDDVEEFLRNVVYFHNFDEKRDRETILKLSKQLPVIKPKSWYMRFGSFIYNNISSPFLKKSQDR